MPLAIPVIDFLILVVVLSSVRTRLVYELTGLSLLLFHSARPGLILYSILVLPGTIIHELSHWLAAELLHVRTGEIVILPDLSGEEQTKRLGSVATERSDPFRGFLIGVAPFITGNLILLVLGRLLQLGWGSYPTWQLALLVYGIMVTGNSMILSREDRRTWPVVIILTTLILLALRQVGLTFPSIIYLWITSALNSLNLVLLVTAGLNLVMILGSYLTRRLIEKLTKRRIV